MLQVTCAIIEVKQRVLITQRGQHKSQPLLWEFPGGKIEPNESETECLIREIEEELNLQIKPQLRLTPVVHHYSSFAITLIPYLCNTIGGELKLREHIAYKWAPPSELNHYQWCAADVPIVEEYRRMREKG